MDGCTPYGYDEELTHPYDPEEYDDWIGEYGDYQKGDND